MKEGTRDDVFCTLPWVASPNLQDTIAALLQNLTHRPIYNFVLKNVTT